jgi:hypothetical protein
MRPLRLPSWLRLEYTNGTVCRRIRFHPINLLPVFLCLAGPATAEPTPEPLLPWKSWVLEKHPEIRCPVGFQDAGSRACIWPARLHLDVREDGANFEEVVTVFRTVWVEVPGDPDHWPIDIHRDGQPWTVLLRDGRPQVELPAGTHTLRGRFVWSRMPEALPIPVLAALVSFTKDARPVPRPTLRAGKLWLTPKRDEAIQEDRLEIEVYRRLIDDSPFRVETRLALEVSGRPRREVLSQAVLPGFVPLRVDSPVPFEWDKTGRLLVDVRPGQHAVTVEARNEVPVRSLRFLAEAAWPSEEVWVFEAQPDLRTVELSGASSIDPNQTNLPEAFRSLPAFLVRTKDTLTLEEKHRGSALPREDQLSLQRTLWLDFNGEGFTALDDVRGRRNLGFRMNAQPDLRLGRVSIDGQDQFITMTSSQGPNGPVPGVEIRKADIALIAEGRLIERNGTVSAGGWDLDFESVQQTLKLPPGWRLFSAVGVDQVEGSWIGAWTLFDMFLVLVLALACGHLWGWIYGLVALLTLILTLPEPHAPVGSWAVVFFTAAVLKTIPEAWGSFRKFVRWSHFISILGLTVIVILFALQHLRTGLFPALEAPSTAASAQIHGAETSVSPVAEEEGRAYPASAEPMVRKRKALYDTLSVSNLAAEAPIQSPLRARDPGLAIQTGPGLPNWSWGQSVLSWSGTVSKSHQFRLFLVSPNWNRVLAVLRVGLILLLLLRSATVFVPQSTGWLSRIVVIVLAAGPTLLASETAHAGFPSPELLSDLEARLTKAPSCAPQCATLQELRLSGDAHRLILRLEVHAGQSTAVPLPGHASKWLPDSVWLDGQPAKALLRSDQTLSLAVPSGPHRVELSGPPSSGTTEIPLPARPQRASIELRDFTVEGIHTDGTIDASLFLAPKTEPKVGTSRKDTPMQVPDFVHIVRDVHLDLDWTIETTVTRVTSPDSVVPVSFPLLEGESVTTQGVRVVDRRAEIILAPRQLQAIFRSVLLPRDSLHLEAEPQRDAGAVAYNETWQVFAAPLWHVDISGLPQLGPSLQNGATWTFRPWRGESVDLKVQRPTGAEGHVRTIDESTFEFVPGDRSTDFSLKLQLRASRGGEYRLQLPEDSTLKAVSINGRDHPSRPQDGRLVLPVTPGAQDILVSGRAPHPIGIRYATPKFDLGQESVNQTSIVNMPASRWVLWTEGPRLGPVVLFWSTLLVFLMLAWGLARAPKSPLRLHQWFLLLAGLTQTHWAIALLVVAWFWGMVYRGEQDAPAGPFNLRQLVLAGWTAMSIVGLMLAIHQGLLGNPDMQIGGNQSGAGVLRWYSDRIGPSLPEVKVWSLPMWVYRVAMLAWATWLAIATVGWARWGWVCFTRFALWKEIQRKAPSPKTPA